MEKRTVLVAEDQPDVLLLVRTTIEDESYEIVEASDGETALALARDCPPVLALLDVMMPKMSGIEVCRALKTDPRTAQTIVVMLSAYADPSVIAAARDAGADDYLTKPFSPLTLISLVHDAMAGAESP